MMKIRVVMRNGIFFFSFKNFFHFQQWLFFKDELFLLIYVSLKLFCHVQPVWKLCCWSDEIQSEISLKWLSFCQDDIFGKWLCNSSLRNLILKISWLSIEEENPTELIILLNHQRLMLFLLFKKKTIHF